MPQSEQVPAAHDNVFGLLRVRNFVSARVVSRRQALDQDVDLGRGKAGDGQSPARNEFMDFKVLRFSV